MTSVQRVVTRDEALAPDVVNLQIWSAELRDWTVQPFPIARLNSDYRFQSLYRDTESAGYYREAMNITFFVAQIHLRDLMTWFKFFTLKDLRRICEVHSVIYRSQTKAQLTEYLLQHPCSAFCGEYHIVTFKPLGIPRSIPSFTVNLDTSDHVIQPITYPVETLLSNELPIESHDHLNIMTDDQKSQLLLDWKNHTSTDALKVAVCASCGRKVLVTALKTIHQRAKITEMLTLLRNPSLPLSLRPRRYNIEEYQGAILHHRGLLETNTLGPIQLCMQCLRSLDSGKMPRFALANDLYTAMDALPASALEAFTTSTLAERMLICRARVNKICCQFNAKDAKTYPPDSLSPEAILSRARKGIKGNVMVLPLDTIRMRTMIPPPVSSIRDTLCALFVGWKKPAADEVLTTRKTPMLVRRSRVKTMIDFLLDNNHQYRPQPNFAYSPENFERMLGPGDEGVPLSVEIGYMDENQAVQVSTADYTPRNEGIAPLRDPSELLMENVGYTDGDTSPANYFAMKAFALDRCKEKKPFIASGTGNTPIPDFQNPNILTWLFPHLDPWGIAGFNHSKRRVKLSIEEQLRYFLELEDPRFQEDTEFAFVFFNIVRKMHVAQSMQFSVKPSAHSRLASGLMALDHETLTLLGKKLESNPLYIPAEQKEQEALQVMSTLSMIARQIPGSNGYKVNLRNQIRAMINFRGPPTLFITLNPADVDNPIVRVLNGEHISLEDISRGEDMDSWHRKMLAAKRPGACAQFFDIMITKFIDVALRFNSKPIRPGVFGICDAYYGTVEAQGKGTLHCHMLLWIQGHLSPQKLRDAMSSSTEYRDRVFDWAESVIKCEFPVASPSPSITDQPLRRVRYKELGNPHPGVIPAPLTILRAPNGQYDWTEFNHFLCQLLMEYNWHVHNSTCFKYLRKGEPQNDQTCRLRMNGETMQVSSLDPDTGGLILRRHHPKIAAYNPLITVMLKSNTEIKYIGSGRAARDLVYYITDYVTKPTLPLHVGMAALQYAIDKVNDKLADTTEGYSPAFNVKAVTSAVNSMMGRHEISQQQVMSYLVGGGDHYTSDQFSTLNWGQMLAYIDSVYENTSGELPAQNNLERIGANLHVSICDNSITASNQTLDYMYRNAMPPFDDLCLYDFVAYTRKSTIPQVLLKEGNIEALTGTFSSWEHPQRGSHLLKRRQSMHVPVLLGPSIPNPERSPDSREQWAKCVLILFKPWRLPTSLRDTTQTWLQCYEQYRPYMPEIHHAIIRNMNAFAESKDARGSAPVRSRRVDEANENSGDLLFPSTHHAHLLDQPEYDIFEDDGMHVDESALTGTLSDEQTEIQDIYLCTDKSLPHWKSLDGIANQMLGCDVVASLDACNTASAMDVDHLDEDLCHAPGFREATEHDLEDIARYQTIMKELKSQKIVGGTGPNRSNAHHRPDALILEPFVEVMSFDFESEQSKLFPNRADGLTVSKIVEDVINTMNLASNPEQLKAFNLVANHLVSPGDSMDQLLMYVSGVGGTGKSHVIKSIVMLFERLGVREQLLLGAPTGIAAVLIGGQTIHSLALMNPSGLKPNLEGLTSMWMNARYLIIDEVSMVGARLLSQMSNRMREAKYHHPESCSKPFGGVNVIFMGDFGQLKPPVQCSLYAHSIVQNPSFRTASSTDGISAMNGVLLWRQVTKVVELVRNQRQSDDPYYADFLLRIRIGMCTPHPSTLSISTGKTDWAYILERVMTNNDQETLTRFQDAPIVVGTKVIRDLLNAKKIAYHSRHTGMRVMLFHSLDTVSRARVPRGLQNTLWNMNSTENKDALGRLPLFNGMKVMITENTAFPFNIVNGSEGIVKGVIFEKLQPGSLLKRATMAFIHVRGCGMRIPGLDPDVVPISAVATRIERKIKLDDRQIKSGFTRKQLPLIPCYAYTDFKSQGRTLPFIIVDIYTAKAQGVYVMLSRVKSISGLAVLRWFPANKIYSRISAELRDELHRLKSLSEA